MSNRGKKVLINFSIGDLIMLGKEYYDNDLNVHNGWVISLLIHKLAINSVNSLPT